MLVAVMNHASERTYWCVEVLLSLQKDCKFVSGKRSHISTTHTTHSIIRNIHAGKAMDQLIGGYETNTITT